ncbi:MFS transporter [Helcococcus kunzii]|uniref:MFS transporter n=1 Tax=Helcococcus kunzii TaxID=40091 RepID=UPI0024AE8479|nr:MFS transporter [Helcococcus kunzii]
MKEQFNNNFKNENTFSKRLATKQEIFKYSFGGLGSNIAFNFVQAYVLFYFTEILSIDPKIVGTLLLAARGIDAITDPIMGAIADRTRSQMGRYRPYILFGAPLLGVAIAALFWNPGFSGKNQIFWIYFIYILYSLISTVVNIPYHSLTSVLSEDPNQRTAIASAKQFMSVPAIFIVTVLVLPMVKFFGDGEQGWFIVASILGLIIIISFLLCSMSAKRHDILENIKPSKRKMNIKSQFELLTKNKPLLMLVIAMGTNNLANAAQQGVAIHFWTYNINRIDLFPKLNFIGLVLSIPVFILMPKIASKIGKKKLFVLGTIAAICPFLTLLFVPYNQVTIIFIMLVINAILGPFTGALPWAMLPDTIDFGEWKVGIRGDGLGSSTMTFFNKLGGAIGGSLAATFLAYGGYVANQAQSQESLNTILLIFTIFPILGHLASLISMKWYNIDNKMHEKITNELNKRKTENK